ncbi:MAG: peptidase [Candidatus Acidoferrum typicum]|nr:peptidase [Candidatus Acidoferrum typicum]
MNFMKRPRALISIFLAMISAPFSVTAQTLSPNQQLARDIYKELVEINTVTATGDTSKAAEAMAARLRAAGYSGADVQAFNPAPRKGNLVARLHGTGARKPILLMAHLDVVEARREDWSVDPFKLLEKDGYFYARGSGDDKFMAATFVANLIRYKQEGFKPDRDIILLLETDEEIGDRDAVGIQWMIKNHHDLIDAEFVLNEGGRVGLKNGKPLRNDLQTSEKVFVNYSFEVRNSGGHSSLPTRDNAIYHLAEGLARLSKYDFPVVLNETTRSWLERAAPLEDPQIGAAMNSVASGRPDPAALARLSAMPAYNAQLRTTCVATMLEAGHAFNALPQRAQATINCRVLPGESIEDVQKTLVRVVDDNQISVAPTLIDPSSKPSPLSPEIVQAVERVTAEFWPGIPVIPTMSSGATDGLFLRNAGIPTYGTSGLAGDIDDVRSHGKDERILVKSFNDGQEYLYRLVKILSSRK